MKTEKGVIGILFVGLFALLFGAFIGYKSPGIFKAPETEENQPQKNPVFVPTPSNQVP